MDEDETDLKLFMTQSVTASSNGPDRATLMTCVSEYDMGQEGSGVVCIGAFHEAFSNWTMSNGWIVTGETTAFPEPESGVDLNDW